MKILLIAEHDNQKLNNNTLHALSAARKLGDEIHLLVAGENSADVAAQARYAKGVSKVLWADDSIYAHALPENLSELIAKLAKDYRYIICAASVFGKSLLPRVAALLDVDPLSDVIEIIDQQTFIRPIYAGRLQETVKLNSELKIISVRSSAFALSDFTSANASPIESIAPVASFDLSSFVNETPSDQTKIDLNSARIIVAGGRGFSSAENFQNLLYPLADKLKAAIGASRAAVDAGFAPNDYQIGQTGKIVAPELYIAIGISGAIQHLAGMKDSKIIVAINNNAEEPIFNVADFAIVGDLNIVLPELTRKL